MPFRISWGPGAGAVTVIVETATEALAMAAAYEDDGHGDIEVTTMDGAALSTMELKALAAMGSGADSGAAS